MGMEEKRICKRCLIRELAGQEKTYETIRQYIEDIEPEKKAVQELYEQRLESCKACERLLEGMCRACGCYVELRAATALNTCPYGLW